MATASAISELASVPIVDFSSFLSGNEAQKQEVAQQVDQAFQDVGFVSLVNHGVDARKVAEAFEWVSTRVLILLSSLLGLNPLG